MSALLLDTFREIKRSLSRFISIFAIIALGCGFFAGIKATMPDMVESASEYFDDRKLMDLKLQSSVGVRSEDVDAVRRADNVEAAIPGYSKDVYYYYENQNCVIKVMSLPNETMGAMNTPVVLEGRLPERSGECVVENKVTSPTTFRVGNKLTFTSPSASEDIGDIFTTDTFEIVGIITSPLYIGHERDASNIGNGEVLSYVMIGEEDFSLGYYSEVYLRFTDMQDYDPFSEAYTDAVNEKKVGAVEAFRESVTGRYDKLVQESRQQIETAKQQLGKLESVLALSPEDAVALLEAAQAEYDSAKAEYDVITDKESLTAMIAAARLSSAKDQLEMLGAIASGDASARAALEEQYRTAQDEITAAEEELSGVSEVKFYESDRFTSTDYASFKGDAEKIDAIAKVFPAFFILIAALVTLTTMTRMIDEHRTQIGTYKALGYPASRIVMKYLIYAFSASVLGGCIGTVIGLQVFPSVIYNTYKIMYNIPDISTPFRPMYMLVCILASVACTGSAVMYAAVRSLRSQPSELMRPKPPASGRRVLLERIGIIWNRLDFLMKVTVRNLLRYKKRFFMTIAGIAGCTALIITGFGLKNSIKTIADKQFGEVFQFSANVVLAAEDNESAHNALDTLRSSDAVESAELYLSVSSDGRANGAVQTVNLTIPEHPEAMGEYVKFENIDGSGIVSIGDDSVLITEKLSMMLGLKAGDMISLRPNGMDERQLRVGAVVKHYAMHYVYISPELYERTFGEKPVYRLAYLNTYDDTDTTAFKESIIADKQFLGISYKGESSKGFLNSVDSLDTIVLVLIVCAGLLAIIVLYNLANINIAERVREIATIKVLGFFDGETSAYIYRENVISCLLGIAVGLGLGKLLHYFVVITSEVDIVLFNRELVWWAFLAGAVLTLVFAVLVNIVLHFKLKRVDMVESLKSIE